jgi:integrase
MKVTSIERSPGVWRLRIEIGRDASGKRMFRYETLRGTADDAARRRFAILQAHEDNSFAVPSKVTFGAFYQQWIDRRRALDKITRTTAENYTKIARYFLAPIAGKQLQRVTAQDVQAIYTEAAPRVSKGTLAHVHKILSACFKAARKAKLVKVNVMEEVEAPVRPRIKPGALSQDRAAELVASLEGHWLQPVVSLSLVTGMRRGEVLGLRWSDVDLDAARIAVRGQLVQYEDGSVHWTPTKTDAGLRVISVGLEAVELLAGLRRAAAERRMKLGLGGKLDDTYVFVRDDGVSPIKPASLTRTFWEQTGGEMHFHALRHTHLTHLLARVGKAGVKAVAQRAGHADITTTLSIYQTVFEEDDRALADMSGGLIRKGPR